MVLAMDAESAVAACTSALNVHSSCVCTSGGAGGGGGGGFEPGGWQVSMRGVRAPGIRDAFGTFKG